MNFMTRYERIDPSRDLGMLRDRFADLFNFNLPRLGVTEHPALEQWTPVTDVYETKDAVLFTLELPGLTEKNVDIEVEQGILTIRGERKFEKEEKEKDFLRVERSYGTFVRSFTLPPNVAVDRVNAKLENGILNIEVPKLETAKAKHITINIKETPRAKVAA